MDRRLFLTLATSAALGGLPARADVPRMVVAKSPSCGCCGAWVAHMQATGFEVAVNDLEQPELDTVKRRLGVPPQLSACHTAEISGYFIEGHVPAEDVQRLLAESPDAAGLSVPGMPIGSPGMEMDGALDPFDTLLVARSGGVSVFQAHR